MDDGTCSDWFSVGQGLRQGCNLAPLLFNLFFAAMLMVAFGDFENDANLMEGMVKVRKIVVEGKGKKAKRVERVRAFWSMLYADDATIISRSPASLENIMSIIVRVAGQFGLMVSEPKTETMCMLAKNVQAHQLSITAAGMTFRQTPTFVYLGGQICQDETIDGEIRHRVRRAWACFRRHGQAMYDRARAPLRLNVRLLQAEVVEALLYGCVTWNLKPVQYGQLRAAHHQVLLRCIGWTKRVRTDRPLSYAEALTRAGCEECIEATVRRRRLCFAGFVVRMTDDRLPKFALMGELEGRQRYVGGQEFDWVKRLKEDCEAFDIDHIGGEWVKSARDMDEWYELIEDGAAHFMRGWLQKAGDAKELRRLGREREEAEKEADAEYFKNKSREEGKGVKHRKERINKGDGRKRPVQQRSCADREGKEKIAQPQPLKP